MNSYLLRNLIRLGGGGGADTSVISGFFFTFRELLDQINRLRYFSLGEIFD